MASDRLTSAPLKPAREAPRLLDKPVGATLWRLAWPTTIGLFCVLGVNLLDTLYVGRLGSAELAAIGFCFPVIFSLGAVGFGLSAGATAAMSQAIGRGDQSRMRATATNTLVLAAVALAALAIIGLLTIDPLFAALGAEPDVIALIRRYMTVYYWGLPIILLPVVLNGFIRATGETLLPAAVMVTGALMNALVSWLLVFGHFGAPALGIAGAAWGAVAARATMTVASIVIIHFREKLLDFKLVTFSDFWPAVSGVVMVGVPAIAAQIITPLSSAALTRLLSEYGRQTVAAFAVGARIEALFLIAFWALQSGVAPFVGQNYGARRFDRIAEAQVFIRRFAVLWAAATLVSALTFGDELSALFTEDGAISAMSARYFVIVAAGFVGAGLMLGATSVFYSLGRPLMATGVVALRFIGLYVPLGFILSRTMGPDGVFAAACASYLIAGIAGALLVSRTLKGLMRAPA